jgi:hypothetical protein
MKVYYSSSHLSEAAMIKIVFNVHKSLKVRIIDTFLQKNLIKLSKKLINNFT